MATTDLSAIDTTSIALSAQKNIAAHPIQEFSSVNNVVQPGLGEEVKGVLTQTTTLPRQSSINYVSDINIEAYMRRQTIDFFVYNMRPNRRLYPFFSGKDISKIVQKPNIVELNNNKSFYSLLPKTTSELSRLAGSSEPRNRGIVVCDKQPTIIATDVNGNQAVDPNIGREIDLNEEVITIGIPQPDRGGTTTPIAYQTIAPPICPPVTEHEDNGWTPGDGGTIVGPIETQSEYVIIGGGIARVYYTEYAKNGRTILYISEIEQMNPDLITMAGNTVMGIRSQSTASVVSYQHHSGWLRLTDTPTTDATNIGGDKVYESLGVVRLSQDASNEDGYYVGNSFTILDGYIPGETTRITSYIGATRKAYVDPPLKGVKDLVAIRGVKYSIGDARDPYISGNIISHYSSTKGFFAGTIHLPGPSLSSPFKFTTGEKLFKITDSAQNDSDDATTIAEYIYNSFGLNISRGQIIVNNPDGKVTVGSAQGAVPTADAAPLLPPVNDTFSSTASAGGVVQGYKKISPVAQSFYISEVDYPKGIFVPYIDLFFSTKGSLPVEVQLRVMTNGYPDAKSIIPGAVSVVESEDVRISVSPDPTNPLTYTRFTFNSPVYLFPGFEYAMIVSSNDYDYEIYATELGEKIIGSDRIVSEQPFLGSLFRSQNGSTYSAIQTEDLMFVIHKCEFVNNGQIEFFEEKFPEQTYEYWQRNTYYNSNTAFDVFSVHSDSIEIPGTTLDYSYRATNLNDLSVDPTYTTFKPDYMIPMSERKVVFGKEYPTVSFKMKLGLTTTSKDVSPIIYVGRQNLARSATIINDLWITPGSIQISNTGNGYTTQNTSVIITANTGSGANGYPLFLINNGANISANGLQGTTSQIGGFYLDGRGSGYAEDINISIVSSDANVVNAVVRIPSETDPSGGPAAARYISKTVSLAPEFNAGDLRVFLTAIKPINTNIYVYYKVKNTYDNEAIEEKRWTLMKEVTGPGGEIAYTSGSIPIELEYRPSFSSNTIVYSSSTATFNTFNQYKIKIVMASAGTTLDSIPYIFDMRAIAIPGTE
jgi:hypothetical protein